MRSYRFRIGSLTAVGALLIGLPTCSSTQETSKPGEAPAPVPVGPVEESAAIEAIAAIPVGRVAARDERGYARTVLGNNDVTRRASPIKATAETAARMHLVRNANLLGASDGSIRDAALTGTHDVAGGGTIVQFEQRVHGIEVFRARSSVLIDADRNLVSISNGLTPASAITGLGKSATFKLSAEAAVANAYAARAGVKLGADAVRDLGARGDFRGYAVASPGGAMRVLHASAKQVYYPKDGKLVPAYYVEFLARAPGSRQNQGWGIVVSSNDGTELYETSLTQFDAFNYRVWAAATGDKIPMDGPIVDSTPYPGGVPDKKAPVFAMPVMVAMEGFNKGGAVDGGAGPVDPWLPATATVTFGNNVEAYSDRNQYIDGDSGATINDGYNEGGTALDGGYDFRADTTAALTFDRIYNTALAPNSSVNQIKAAVTQLFYTTNWLHDYWYDSGFNEAGHNAQRDNLMRGGVGGDPLHVEAQDSADDGLGNNANMSTFSDGISPRMQMYVWNGLPNRILTTTPTPTLTFADGLGAASFGLQTFNITQQGVIANDGTAPTSDACEPITANLTNRVVVIDRGTCSFTLKVANAKAAGAAGVILVNNAAGNAPPNPGAAPAPGEDVTGMALLGVSLEDGGPLKTAIGAGTVNIHMQRGVEAQLDGTIDNTIVAHEWGHYWHHRLVFCGSKSCGGMSEGWGDFSAIMLVVKEGDTFGPNVYPLAQYAMAGLTPNAGYFGIRRAPYSEALTKNPFTFKHIRQAEPLPTGAPLAPAGADMSEVHNVGEIWTQTLFQAYIRLLAIGPTQTPARTFAESKRRMADYIVQGMKNTPPEPTFVEQRDAILRPIYTAGKTDPGRKADFAALAKGFAERGLGAGAIAPPVGSENLNEAVEDFSTKGSLVLESFTIDDSLKSCDNDGVLDAGESGVIKMNLANGGWEDLAGSTVTVSTTDPNLTFDNGGTATVASIETYGTATVSINVTAKATTPQRTVAALKITLANPNAARPTFDIQESARLNYDDKAGVSASDDVESESKPPAWTPKVGTIPFPIRAWSRGGDILDHYWHGNDTGAPSDEYVESPSLVVSSNAPFVMNFSHRYSFEADVGGGIYYDGGIIEISEDNGVTWKDVATYAGIDPGYTQRLASSLAPPAPDAAPTDAGSPDANPLAGRMAFASDSPGYPSFLTTSLNFGSAFVGKTVKVRFRIGTDEGSGAPGWDIDNFSFGGPQFSSLTNTPFGAITNNAGICTDGGGAPDGGTTPEAGRPDAIPDVRPDTGGMTPDSGRTDVATDTPSGDVTVSDAPKPDVATPTDAARDTGTNPTTTGGGGTTDDGCDCSVPGGRAPRNSAAMLSVLGALAMVLRRRRRITH
jgi:MYXO-CTERM domain-containing protein